MQTVSKAEKAYDFPTIMRRIFDYILAGYKWKACIVLMCIVVTSLAEVIVVLLFRTLLDSCLASSWEVYPISAIQIIAFMALSYYAGILGSFIYRCLMAEITRGTTKKVRTDLFAHMERMPIKYFDTQGRGVVMSIFTNDTDTLRQLINSSIPNLISSTITIVSVLIGMFWLNFKLAVVTVVAVFCISLAAGYMTEKNVSFYGKQQKELAGLNRYMEEMLAGQTIVKLFSHEHQNVKEFEIKNDRLRDSAFRLGIYSNTLSAVMTDGSYFAYEVSAVAGFLTLGEMGMAVGTLAAFLQLGRMLIQPVSKISSQINYIITAKAGAERIFRFLDEKPEMDSGNIRLTQNAQGQWIWKLADDDGCCKNCALKGKIDFSDVGFQYKEHVDILKHITCSVPAGSSAAIVGPTGAGKTTLLQLLARFYDPTYGEIFIDGFPLSEIRKSDIRKAMGIVTQDIWLFTGTIRENICFGNDFISEKDMIQAAKKAFVHDFIMELPDGYDTLLTDHGRELSEGQRQLLAIARVLVADPPFLLMDEATAALDTRTEHLLQKSIENLMHNRTILLIAHRLEAVQSAGKIIVVKDGQIEEVGTQEAYCHSYRHFH